MPGFFWWFVIGGAAGWAANRWFPSRPPQDLTMAVILGLVGAAIGGVLSTRLLGSNLESTTFDVGGFLLAALASVVILAAFLWLAPHHETRPYISEKKQH